MHIGATKRRFGTRLQENQKAYFSLKNRKSCFVGACLSNHPYDSEGIITTNPRYHQERREAWHINSASAQLNC